MQTDTSFAVQILHPTVLLLSRKMVYYLLYMLHTMHIFVINCIRLCEISWDQFGVLEGSFKLKKHRHDGS